MSKRCPECRNLNEDSKIFCSYCGATLDTNLRLIQDLEKQTERPTEASAAKQQSEVRIHSSRSAPKKKEKKSAAPWIILGLIAAAVIVWFFLQ